MYYIDGKGSKNPYREITYVVLELNLTQATQITGDKCFFLKFQILVDFIK